MIAGNLCVDTLRRRSRQTPVEESRLQAADVGTYETEDAILQDVDSKLVAAAFGQLSERHRRVLQLREGNDWSYREIAEHEGVGITAVETLLWRARQALKREFMLLDGQKGRLGSLAGLLTLLRVRILGGVVGLARHPAATLRHLLGHLGSGIDRTFGTSGAFGVFGPSAAAATGAVVLGMGTLLMAPTAPAPAVTYPSVVSTAGASSVSGFPVPAFPAPTFTAPPTGSAPLPGAGSVPGIPSGAASTGATSGSAAAGGPGISVAGLPPVGGGATGHRRDWDRPSGRRSAGSDPRSTAPQAVSAPRSPVRPAGSDPRSTARWAGSAPRWAVRPAVSAPRSPARSGASAPRSPAPSAGSAARSAG